jgi:hypothetical protein
MRHSCRARSPEFVDITVRQGMARFQSELQSTRIVIGEERFDRMLTLSTPPRRTSGVQPAGVGED